MKRKIQQERSHHLADKGFTMVELLVVIAIISILMAILLPALGKARDFAKNSICANNLRQCFMGITYYTLDYGDFMPNRTDWTSKIFTYYNTKATLMQVSGNSTPYWVNITGPLLCPNTPKPPEGPAWTGTYDNKPILTSYGPTVVPTKEASFKPSGQGGMAYAALTDSGSTCYKYKKITQVKDGSILIIEKNLYNYTTGSNLVAAPDTYSLVAYSQFGMLSTNPGLFNLWGASFRHNKTSNFLFLDGHVEGYRLGQRFTDEWQPQ